MAEQLWTIEVCDNCGAIAEADDGGCCKACGAWFGGEGTGDPDQHYTAIKVAPAAQIRRLEMAVREVDSKATKLGDPIREYRLPCGPWHRVLALTGTGPVERSEAEHWRERAENAESALAAAEAREKRAKKVYIKRLKAWADERDEARQALREIGKAADDLSDLSRLLPEGSQARALCERALAKLDGVALPEPAPGDDKKRVDRDHFTSTVEGAEAYARLHPDFGGPSGDR